MSEKKRYVEILNYQVTMACDYCGKGDMEYIKDNTLEDMTDKIIEQIK